MNATAGCLAKKADPSYAVSAQFCYLSESEFLKIYAIIEQKGFRISNIFCKCTKYVLSFNAELQLGKGANVHVTALRKAILYVCIDRAI